MKRLQHTYLIGLVTATLLIGCGGSGDASTTSNQTSADTNTPSSSGSTVQCKQIEPVLKTLNKKYATSKDDYDSFNSTRTIYKGSKGSSDGKGSSDSGGLHNEGRNCLSCHSFASAGTVFTSLNAANNTPGAAGYRIQLNDSIVFDSARGTGNSRSSSFPSGNFTAHVIDPNGNIVNSSADMSHDASRRACNSCHSSTGNNGAPGRITSARLASTPSTATPAGATATTCVSFNSNVMPILEAKCKSCHGSNGNFKVTTPNATYSNISALKGSATAGGQYLLDKGSNTVGHGGGQVISPSSGEYTTIKAWVTEAATNN